MNVVSNSAFPGKLTDSQVAEIVAKACPAANYRGKKVLLIVPGPHAHRAGRFDVQNAPSPARVGDEGI